MISQKEQIEELHRQLARVTNARDRLYYVANKIATGGSPTTEELNSIEKLRKVK